MKARRVEGLDLSAPLRPGVARIVRVRLDELRSFAPAALESGAAGAQHDMRIAAKRLRYVLEIAGPCFGADARAACDTAKRLQGVLGEVHDCDVMLLRAEGIVSLREQLRARRGRRFAEFRDLWREAVEGGAWARLERSLDVH